MLGRRAKQSVSSLKSEDKTLTSTSDIANHFVNHFSASLCPPSFLNGPHSELLTSKIFYFARIEEDQCS